MPPKVGIIGEFDNAFNKHFVFRQLFLNSNRFYSQCLYADFLGIAFYLMAVKLMAVKLMAVKLMTVNLIAVNLIVKIRFLFGMAKNQKKDLRKNVGRNFFRQLGITCKKSKSANLDCGL